MKSPSSEFVSDASSNAQFQLLRAFVEREVRRSAVIMVTSAQPRDGKSMTAFSLATSLSHAGFRTALVAEGSRLRDAARGGPATLAMPRPEPGRFRETTAEFLSHARSTYDYTIVDTAPLLADPLALGLAGSVDGVLVSVRVGRAPTDDDELTIRVIEQSSGRVLGIVAALPEAIDDFEDRRSAKPRAEDVPRRAAVSRGIASVKSLQSLFVGMVVLVFTSLLALAGASANQPHRALGAHVPFSSTK